MITRALRQQPFLRNVLVLMTGTAAAQVLTTAAAPILTRLFAPDDFGVLGVFLAISGIVANVAALRYEMAIVIPEDDDDAVNVLGLALSCVAIVSLLVAAVVTAGRSWLAELMRAPSLAAYLWMAPLYIAGSGAYLALNYWSTRKKSFSRLSISRVFRSLGVVVTQLAAGIGKAGAGGLVLGQVLGQGLASVVLGLQVWRDDWHRIRNSLSIARISELARRYSHFPLFSGPQTLLNSISQATPAFMFGALFGPTVVGLYWFTHRLLMLPTDLIGQSVRQVFFQRAAELHNSGQDVHRVLLKATLGLAGIALPVVVAFGTAGPWLFGFIFGSEWETAGSYARWMVLWWASYFVNPPSVMLVPVFGLQKQHMIYEIMLLAARIGSIVLGAVLGNASTAIALFSITGMIFNIGLVLFVMRTARRVSRRSDQQRLPITVLANEGE